MSKEYIIQDLPFTEQLKKAGINVEGNFEDVVNQITDRIGNRDLSNRMVRRASGRTLQEIANSWEKNGFKGLRSNSVQISIRKGLKRLNEQNA